MHFILPALIYTQMKLISLLLEYGSLYRNLSSAKNCKIHIVNHLIKG